MKSHRGKPYKAKSMRERRHKSIKRTRRKRRERRHKSIRRKTKSRKGRKAGVLGRAESVALLQSLYKTTMKDFPPEIVKDIASKIHPELREDVKNELLRRTRGARDRLKRLEEDDEDEPEDEFGRHFRSEYECMGCESGASNTFAHCRACREGRI